MNNECCNHSDLNAYLERIGLAGRELPPTAATVSAVIDAHLMHIPFETLDSWTTHEPPSLEIDAIIDKLVRHRRGGWCFEQNALLHAMLQALGFEVYPVGVRLTGIRGGTPAISHRGEVCVLDGKHYYCDVGYGGELFRSAVPLDGSVSPYGFFARQEGEYTALYKNPDSPEVVLKFVDHPYVTADFDYVNYALAARPGLPFREHLYVSILTPEGHRKLLFDLRMEETDGSETVSVTEVPDRSALAALLLEHFGIEFAFDS